MMFLAAVFLYDLVWLLANLKNDSIQEMKLWTVMACAVIILAGLMFFITRAVFDNNVIAEESALAVVMIYILIDFAELVSGKTFFLEWIRKLLPKTH